MAKIQFDKFKIGYFLTTASELFDPRPRSPSVVSSVHPHEFCKSSGEQLDTASFPDAIAAALEMRIAEDFVSKFVQFCDRFDSCSSSFGDLTVPFQRVSQVIIPRVEAVVKCTDILCNSIGYSVCMT
jgi:hypothetical protein